MKLIRLIFFPLFIGYWLFRLPWVIYLALATGVGYFAYDAYEDYRFNVFEADFHVAAGVPDATPLSSWNRFDDVTVNGEVNVQGLYFRGLASGTFDPIGLEQAFILLADEEGRELKAALIVRPVAVPAVERLLSAQGTGDTISVTVNGMLIRNTDWANALGRELDRANIPRADDFVLIAPVLGDRAAFIHQRAEDSIGVPIVLGALAGILGLYGVIRLLFSLGGARKTSAAQAKNRARAETQAKRPTQKALPSSNTPKASPWGSFKPIDSNGGKPPPVPKSASPEVWPKPSAPAEPAKGATRPATPKPEETVPSEPEFISVFPGGGSGFKFKTADQIIRQTFGTFSGTTDPKPRE